MKVTYVSHACLLIDTGNTLIATGPWFDDPAFCDRWNVFSRPVHPAGAEDASVYLISHPHKDHLHEPTLRRLCARPKRVFYPFSCYPETIAWLRSLGLGDVIEARWGRPHSIDENTKVTFIGAPGQNSIIVVESGEEVLVNINDSLHSEPKWLVDVYVRQLKRRWPRIDIMFCGSGEAGYYPNALHAHLKNDHAVARLRRQLFIHNFYRIAHEVAPRVVVPFAADFALPAPHQLGTNGATTVYAMYPGDRLVNGKLERVSPSRAEPQNGRLDHLIAQQYPQEVPAFCTTGCSESGDAASRHWAVRLAAHLNSQTKFHPRRAITGLTFGLRLRDLDGLNWFNIGWNGSHFDVVHGSAPTLVSMANIETTTSVLEASIGSDWGGDALTIGYACDVTILDSRTPGKLLLCVSLLTRYPRPKSYALTHPARTVDYLCQSAPMVLAGVNSKIRPPIDCRLG